MGHLLKSTSVQTMGLSDRDQNSSPAQMVLRTLETPSFAVTKPGVFRLLMESNVAFKNVPGFSEQPG